MGLVLNAFIFAIGLLVLYVTAEVGRFLYWAYTKDPESNEKYRSNSLLNEIAEYCG